MNTRAFCFDAGDVLYYRPHKGKFLDPFLHDLRLDPNQIDKVAKRELQRRAWCGEIGYADYHIQFLGLLGVPSDQLERGRGILAQEEESVEFFEGVSETLHALRARGFLLGIITDTATPEKIKLQRLARGGFGDVWSAYIASCVVGARKPDPRIYHAALAALNVRAGESVFVGHKVRELSGARQIGMKTVEFNYKDDAPADFHIAHFPELLNLSAFI